MDYRTDRYRGIARLLMTCEDGLKDALLMAIRAQIYTEAERYGIVQSRLAGAAGRLQGGHI